MTSFSKDDIREIINRQGVDNLTAKSVRVMLEEKLGVEPGALKSQKEEISQKIDEVLEEMNNDADDDEASASEEEEEEEAPKKKAKTEKGGKAASSSNDNPNKGKMQCVTRSGEEAPKNIKKMQEAMKMSIKKFLESDKSLAIDVDGNKLTGQPRTFASGACGWYLGGKVEIDVGDKTMWAQVGMNVVIPGSKEWKK